MGCNNSQHIKNAGYVRREIVKGVNVSFGDGTLLAPVGKYPLYGMGLPVSKEHMDKLKSMNIGLLVTCLNDPLQPKFMSNYSKNNSNLEYHYVDANIFEGNQIQLLHCPLVDGGAPSLSTMNTFFSAAKSTIDAGKGVAVHCWQGKGRTGTMIAGYLINYHKIPPGEAINYVRKFSIDSVQTAAQEEYLFSSDFPDNKKAEKVEGTKIDQNIIDAALNHALEDYGVVTE